MIRLYGFCPPPPNWSIIKSSNHYPFDESLNEYLCRWSKQCWAIICVIHILFYTCSLPPLLLQHSRRSSESSSSESSSCSSSSDDERVSRRSKSTSKRSKKEKKHKSRSKVADDDNNEDGDGPVPLSRFFGNIKS